MAVRGTGLGVIGAVTLTAILLFWIRGWDSNENHTERPLPAIPVAAPPCPWREADTELTNWYPGATSYTVSDLILSGKRLELRKALGRDLLPEENALHLYLAQGEGGHLGTVLTRRLHGENGAVEIAVGLDASNVIRHFRIQRIREPEAVVEELNGIPLSGRFIGQKFGDDFKWENAGLSSAAGRCASNIAENVRSLLILHENGNQGLARSHH